MRKRNYEGAGHGWMGRSRKAAALLPALGLTAALVAALGLVAAAGACGPGLGLGCSDVGCIDVTTVMLVAADWPEGDLEIEADFDGTTVRCALAPTDNPWEACDDGRSQVLWSADASAPVEARFQYAADGEVVVRILRDGALVSEHRLTPDYETFRPNGDLCPPECRGATETIDVAF